MADIQVNNNEMLTSFSNPNYTLNNATDDEINSNLPPALCDNNSTTSGTKSRRQRYAQIDLATMGISTTASSPDSDAAADSPAEEKPVISPAVDELVSPDESVEQVDSSTAGESVSSPYSGGFLGYYASLELCAKEQQEKDDNTNYDKSKVINSPDSNDSGIQADGEQRANSNLYAAKTSSQPQQKEQQDEAVDKNDSDIPFEVLPPGWEKHSDESGPYYWHIKSGTIQREAPQQQQQQQQSADNNSEEEWSATETKPLLEQFEGHALKFASASLNNIGQCSEAAAEAATEQKALIRFAVRSLGWVCIAEEDLTPERSSKAVNKCIVDLSLGRNDLNDVVGRWGDGKDLFMDLDDEHLSLMDPQDMSVLNVQPIHSIRVWGVGRDNGRDFAYVARDRTSRKHMCHVFRCDTPARQIANTLRDICKKIMVQRQIQQGVSSNSGCLQRISISRPTNLPNLVKDSDNIASDKPLFSELYTSASFPTPMEEPKKVIRCHYLGTAHVAKPNDQKASVDILNSAMEKVYARVPPEKWVFTSVAVAPSTITICEHGTAGAGGEDNILAECRVRFLSFMGIAMRNVKLCSFIMHTAQDKFISHVFHCEPSAGALCKTIEAACKLRYQKCLDADQIQMQNAQAEAQQQNKCSPPDTPTSPTANAVAMVASSKLATSLKASMQNVFDIIKKKTTDLKS